MPINMKAADPADQSPLGHNKPPSAAELLRQDLETATEGFRARRDELLAAADRVPPEIDSEELAGRVADFIKQLTAAHKAAETARIGAKEPHLEAGRIVDGVFKSITEPLYAAKQKIEARLTLWQRKVAEAERRRREEIERKAREEADRAAKASAEAQRAAIQAKATIDEAVTAEARARQAEADATVAQRAAEAKPAELSLTRGDYGATASLRANWTGEMIDRAALDLETLRPHIAEEALNKAIRSFVRAGGRSLSGARIFEHQHSVVR